MRRWRRQQERLPDSLTSVGSQAFMGCTSLALTRLPEGLTSIGDRAFEGCIFLGPHFNLIRTWYGYN